jgi:hypothetical protein
MSHGVLVFPQTLGLALTARRPHRVGGQTTPVPLGERAQEVA